MASDEESLPSTSAGKTVFRKGSTIKSQGREMIVSVREFFKKENDTLKKTGEPVIPFSKIAERTARALQIGTATVTRVCREKSAAVKAGQSSVSTPGKERKHAAKVTELDPFQEDALRRHVYGYYKRREHPTLDKMLVSATNTGLFSGAKTSLWTVLRDLGFHYSEVNGRKVLMEREDIVAWRCRYLSSVKQKDFTQIIWLDETWVNASHSESKGWTDNTLEGTMTVPIGKGGRLIVLHAGTSKGFVPNALLMFRSKKTGDYHEEMDHNRFYKWFEEQLLPNIDPNSVIVMDNAPYHTVQIDKAPTMSSKKSAMIEWLERHGVQAGPELKKGELLDMVLAHKPRFPIYKIDELAKSHGHEIIRLPPYHCHFNCIEMIWAQLKGHVARNNKKFTLTEVERLINEGFGLIGEKEWADVVRHVEKLTKEAWEAEGILDEVVERFVINITGNTSSESEEDDMDIGDDSILEGIAPLPLSP